MLLFWQILLLLNEGICIAVLILKLSMFYVLFFMSLKMVLTKKHSHSFMLNILAFSLRFVSEIPQFTITVIDKKGLASSLDV